MSKRETVAAKNLAQPDRSTVFLDGSERSVIELPEGITIGRGIYRPGWRWSQHVRPLARSESQQHLGYIVTGRMRVLGKDGQEIDVGPGDAFLAAPGHDAWVLGDEACEALDFSRRADS